jgi:transposase-like protein
MYVRLNGEMVYLWRAVDHDGVVLESYVTYMRDNEAALNFMKESLKRHGSPEAIITDGLRSYGAALTEFGSCEKQQVGRCQQSGRELAPGVQAARAGDAAVSAVANVTEVRLGSRQRRQPLQPRTPPPRQADLQAMSRGCAGSVAGASQLTWRARRPNFIV